MQLRTPSSFNEQEELFRQTLEVMVEEKSLVVREPRSTCWLSSGIIGPIYTILNWARNQRVAHGRRHVQVRPPWSSPSPVLPPLRLVRLDPSTRLPQASSGLSFYRP
ncbi:hypothetical protein PM082_016912 [Marasmius tenuissimus]|nr:hypothetical protein PM082_016912 [Marasmius tenuissimus]